MKSGELNTEPCGTSLVTKPQLDFFPLIFSLLPAATPRPDAAQHLPIFAVSL